jgi:hypothetical protein
VQLDKKVDLLVDDGVLVKSVGFSHFSNYVNYTWPANETTVTRSFSVRESNNVRFLSLCLVRLPFLPPLLLLSVEISRPSLRP